MWSCYCVCNIDLPVHFDAANWIEHPLLDIDRKRSGRSTLQRSAAPFTIDSMLYGGFPTKLHHGIPYWVGDGALFHIRIALDRNKQPMSLTDPQFAPVILDSARLYEANQRWHTTVFLVMPDHIHALLSFAPDQSMSRVVGDRKRFHSRIHHVIWQQGYFDHRLRKDDRGQQLSAKLNYIRHNPVAAGLCAKAEDWPWIIDSHA